MNKVAVFGAGSEVGKNTVLLFSRFGYEVMAFVYTEDDIEKIPGVEYILVGPNDDSAVEEALEQARIVFLGLLFNQRNANRIIDIQDCLFNTVDISEDLPLDKFFYMIEEDNNNGYSDEQVVAVQASLNAYVEDADLKQVKLSQDDYVAELAAFMDEELASIAPRHRIVNF